MSRLFPLAITIWALVAISAWALPVVAWRRRGPKAAAIAALAPIGAILFAPAFMVVYAILEGTASPASAEPWAGGVVAAFGCVLAVIGVRGALKAPAPAGRCPNCGHDCRGVARCPECGRPQ